MNTERRLTHASLFSGIGGAELAAQWVGWRNLFHCEKNPFGRRVLEYWFPESESYEDIRETDFGKWRGRVDVLTGGFPCQPFSCAGKRRGAADDRYLWDEMLRAIGEVRPTWVVGENVAGLLSMVEPGGGTDLEDGAAACGATGGVFTIERVCRDLEGAGYSVQPLVIPACAVGAPHRRDRLWLVAHSGGDGQYHAAEEPAGGGGATDVPAGEAAEEPAGTGGGRAAAGAVGALRADGFAGWDGFPTKRLVCGGDDGLPFDVDGLAVPYKKWWRDTMTAYGNAWVPEVAVEIFRAIDAAERYDRQQKG